MEKTRKDSTKSKAPASNVSNASSFRTIRSVASRLKIANQISSAKRASERDDTISISASTVTLVGIDSGPPTGSLFGSKPDFRALGKPGGSRLNLTQNQQQQQNSTLPAALSEAIPQPRSSESTAAPAPKRLFSELFTSSSTELQSSKNHCEGIISGGDLIFDNDFKSKTITRPYITVMPDVDVRDITEVMLTEWSLPLPRIAVFMLGSVGELSSWHNSRQLAAFKKGLMKAADTTTMWMVTNGLDTGVGKVIGEAIDREQKERSTFRYYENNKSGRSGPFHVIGIANDYNLSYPQQFFGKTITLGSTGPLPSEHRFELNQQHSHFVILNSNSSLNYSSNSNSSSSGDGAAHNQLLLNLIDYLTKSALRSPDEEDDLEDRTNVPCFESATENRYSTFLDVNLGDAGGTSRAATLQAGHPLPMPTPAGSSGCFSLDHQMNAPQLEHQLTAVVEDDTTDNNHLTTPESSNAPFANAPQPSALSQQPETISQMSRQTSVATLTAASAVAAAVTRPDEFTETPPPTSKLTKKPSFVADSKPPGSSADHLSTIVEHNPIPGVDDHHHSQHPTTTATSAGVSPTAAGATVDSPGTPHHPKSPLPDDPLSPKPNGSRLRTTTSLLNSTIIPVVCLVVQGGYETAKLVLDNLRRRNPVIVLRGSGGFADLLSYAYLEMANWCRMGGGGGWTSAGVANLYAGWDAEFVEHSLKPLLASKIVKRFPGFRANALARNLFRDRIIECVRESGTSKGRVFLTVLNMHNSSCNLENLPEHILLALFKSQSRRDLSAASAPYSPAPYSPAHLQQLEANIIRKDLYLTLDWNCSHVALDEVLRRNPSYNLQTEKTIFEIALAREGREDFIDLFLSHGFRVHKYLTPFRLKRLIRFTLSESEFFRTVCMENILGIAVWSLNFEELLERLSMNVSECPNADAFISNEFNQLIYVCTSLRHFVNVEHLYLNIMGLYQVDVESTERKALATLALWAVFNQKFKLAAILWKHSDQPVHLGLILSMALDRLMWFVQEQSAKDELKERSRVFSQAAVGVLDSCYRTDEKRAFELLSAGQNSDWDQKTAVDIAANARDRTFIAHPCCQKWLTKTFNGAIRVRELTWGFFTLSPQVKVILSAFLIFPMYIWIRFVDGGVAGGGGLRGRKSSRKSLEEELQQMTNGETGTGGGGGGGGVDSDASDNEADKQVPERIKLMELSKAKKANGGGPGGDGGNGDPLRPNQQQYKTPDATFRQRNLFLVKQPPLLTMIYLMWNSPITKFWTFQIFYILFLALYSLAVIWPGCGLWWLDTTVCLWMFLMLVEHIRRTTKLFHRYSSVPMLFRSIEILALVMLVSIYLLGRVLTINGRSFSNLFDPYTMKVALCMGLLYFYYRLFAIHLPISPTLGPLLYRFKLMISVDFIHFMRMALILLISGGIVIQTILYPNTELSMDLFHTAFHRSAISLFLTPVDELTVKCNRSRNLSPPLVDKNITNLTSTFDPAGNLSSILPERKFIFPIRPDQCPALPTPMAESCPRTGFWAYFFTFQFLISLKLILLTLLYALFASTASRLQSDTDNIWKFQRYTLVIDFFNRGPLCAPLSLVGYTFEIARYVYRKLACRCLRCGRPNADHVDSKVISLGGAGLGGPGNPGTLGGTDVCESSPGDRLSTEDYNYWRHLAKTYYEGQLSGRAEQRGLEQMMRRQAETQQMVVEEIEHTKHVIRGIKTKITEMERLMFQTQILLEGIQHHRCTNSTPVVCSNIAGISGDGTTTSTNAPANATTASTSDLK